MALNTSNGFINRPSVTRELIRGADGTLNTAYIDTRTGEIVRNPTGYNIIEVDNSPYWNARNNRDKSNQAREEETQRRERPAEKVIETSHEGPGIPNLAGSAIPSSRPPAKETSNESYVNKPAPMGFASLLPGPFGLVGTAANLGVNSKNTSLVNDQREVLGLKDRTTMQNVGSTLTDKQGYVGDVAYNSPTETEVTPVSFEGQTPDGRTALTPNEARMRQETNPSFREASVAEIDNAKEAYENTYGTKGFLTGLSTAVKGLFSDDDEEQKTTQMVTPTAPAAVTQASTGSFPTAPSSPTGGSVNGGSVDAANPTSPDTRDGGFHLGGTSSAPTGFSPKGPGLY